MDQDRAAEERDTANVHSFDINKQVRTKKTYKLTFWAYSSFLSAYTHDYWANKNESQLTKRGILLIFFEQAYERRVSAYDSW